MQYQKFGKLFLCALLTGIVGACTNSSDSGDSDSSDLPPPVQLEERSLSTTTDENGVARFSFTLASDDAAYQLLVFPTDGQSVRLTALNDNAGPVNLDPLYLQVAFNVATDPSVSVNSFNFPFVPYNVMRTNYTATYILTNPSDGTPAPFTELNAKLLTKKDSDLSRGTVGVNVVLVGPVAGSQESRDSIQSIMSIAQGYLSGANLTLDIQYAAFPGSDILPNPALDDPYYLDLSKHMRKNSINIVFATDVDGLYAQDAIYSISTGDAGPALPSTKSVAVLSILDLTGGDGLFDYNGDGATQVNGDETRLAGEEVAQLIGHYLGVTHIVENDSYLTTGSDALTDTQSCVTIIDCRDEKDVRGNIMFPFPIEILDGNLDTYKRDHMTQQQTQLLQRSVLVN
ncbi:MAG: hypothetical protein J0M12_04130 [Deltaproteobacteria bacterium]|nr:hypothetical protein [Deltaproteobacteria bacterium]